jgi:hypothetical protein
MKMKKLMVTGFLCGLLVLGITQNAQAAVGRHNRALVVVSELDTHGSRELRPLYASLEQLTQFSVAGLLRNDYRQIETLANRDATFANFKRTLKELALDSNIHAIDVILSLHGSPGELVFEDQTWSTATMERRFLMAVTRAEQAEMIVLKKKLRMMYNLSCFGSSHRQNFINMGFDMVNGSINVNANSEVEFVPALLAWKTGIGFRDSFAASNNDAALFAADEPIRLMGRLQNNSLKSTNSKKLFSGTFNNKISSDAR